MTGGSLFNLAGPAGSHAGLAAGSINLTGTLTNTGELAAATITTGGAATNSGNLSTNTMMVANLLNQADGEIGTGQGGGADTLPSNATNIRTDALTGAQPAQRPTLTLSESTGGNLTITATGQDIISLGDIEAPSGFVTLNATAGSTRIEGGSVESGGALTLRAGTDVLQSGGNIIAGTALHIEAEQHARQTGGTASAGSLGAAGQGISAVQDLDWGATGLTAPEVFAATAGGDMTLRLQGPLTTLRGALRAERHLTVVGTQGALALTSEVGTATAATGDLRLEAQTSLTTQAADLTAGQVMDLRAGTALTVTGGTQRAVGAARLDAGTDANLTGVEITAGAGLTAQAGTALRVEASNLTATRGDAALGSGGALHVAGTTLIAAGDATLRSTGASVSLTQVTARAQGGTLTLDAAAEATIRDSTLEAAQGIVFMVGNTLVVNPSHFIAGADLTLQAVGAGSFTGGTLRATRGLRVETGGDLIFSGTEITGSSTPALADFLPVRLQAGGNLTLAGASITADRAEMISLTGITTSAGSNFHIGTGLLMAGPQGVIHADGTPTSVRALDPGRLPLVILDTRRGTALIRLPDALTPASTDAPGVAGNAQRWQVAGQQNPPGLLLFGRDDGRPAAPSNAAAGNIVFNMAAGSSPIFALLNGGTATGTLNAGRLGVFGRPGATLPGGRAFEVLGELNGITGIGAARLGFFAADQQGLAPGSNDLSQYRFNDCVLSTINCVAPLSFQLPAIPRTDTFVLANERLRLDESDVLLPNVSDEDY